MDQRLVFASLGLELVFAYWFFPVSLLTDTSDLLAQAKFSVFTAEISVGLTVASIVLMVVGLLHRRGLIPTHSRALVGLSCLAIPGILFWAWWTSLVLLALPEGCDSLTPYKCYFVQAGTYLGYCFFPAIAIPIVTLVCVSRIRTPAESSQPAPETGLSHPRVT